MERSDPRYQAYVEILKEELIPAMGCTEPIALAYAAARAREVLGALPESVQLQVSGSIIKNVKSVIVPNTGHLKGMEAAVAAGIIAGSADRELEVISEVSEDKKAAIRDYLQTVPISIQHIEQGHVFDIIVTERSGDSYAKVRIADFHTNICLIEKNGRVLYEKPLLNEEARRDSRADRSLLNMKDIWDFAETADLQDVADLLERQIRYNNAIAEEGLLGDYGANIGRVLLSTYGNDVSIRAKAKAAAGSDARMNGCELPVIINSGSGNQGITCSVPLIEYAKELHSGKEKLYRASSFPIWWPSTKRPASAPCPPTAAQSVLVRAWRGHRISVRRRLSGRHPHGGQCAGHRVRHRVRRRKGLLRGKDRILGGRGLAWLQHVQVPSGVQGRRRHRDEGHRDHHQGHRPSGQGRHEGDQ